MPRSSSGAVGGKVAAAAGRTAPADAAPKQQLPTLPQIPDQPPLRTLNLRPREVARRIHRIRFPKFDLLASSPSPARASGSGGGLPEPAAPHPPPPAGRASPPARQLTRTSWERPVAAAASPSALTLPTTSDFWIGDELGIALPNVHVLLFDEFYFPLEEERRALQARYSVRPPPGGSAAAAWGATSSAAQRRRRRSTRSRLSHVSARRRLPPHKDDAAQTPGTSRGAVASRKRTLVSVIAVPAGCEEKPLPSSFLDRTGSGDDDSSSASLSENHARHVHQLSRTASSYTIGAEEQVGGDEDEEEEEEGIGGDSGSSCGNRI